MYSQPYKGIQEEIVLAMEPLISNDDSYHKDHKRRMARTLQVLLEQNPVGNLLEIGTSSLIPNALNLLVPELELFVTDFDLSKKEIEDVVVTINNFSKTVHCARVNIENDPLPFKDEAFDFVLLCEVIEHMEVDPMYMLSEINRVMKTGGTLILTTPNAVSTRSITKMLSGLEPYFYMQYRKDRSLYRHNYEYSIYSLMQVVKAAGFDGKIWTEDCFQEPIYEHIDRLKHAGYNLQHYGDNIFTVAHKVSNVVERYPEMVYAD